MIYRHCTSCGKRIEVGKSCSCEARMKRERDKRYDRTKRNKEHTAFYASKAWQSVAAQCRMIQDGIDIYELYETGKLTPGRIVHHIIPIEDDWDKRLTLENTVFLSDSNHQIVHKAYSAGGYEKERMQMKLREFRARWIREKNDERKG